MTNAYNLANIAYHRYLLDDKKVTLKVLRELNAANHAHASLVEGLIRRRHKDKFDEPEALLGAFTRAGDLGIGYGYFMAGQRYRYGIGIRKNRKAAARLHRKGVDKGSISAMLALGTMYGLGDGLAPDPALALALFEKAASARVPYSDRAAIGQDGSILDTVHFNEDEAQTAAMEELGKLYRDGADGVAQCIASAHFWFRRAAEKGSASARSCLGKLPPVPPPPAKRPPEPIRLPIKDDGSTLHGMNSVAAYQKGKGYSGASRPDYKLAARHFEIALQLGHPDARSALKEVEAAVGERAFFLFFAGWNAMLPP